MGHFRIRPLYEIPNFLKPVDNDVHPLKSVSGPLFGISIVAKQTLVFNFVAGLRRSDVLFTLCCVHERVNALNIRNGVISKNIVCSLQARMQLLLRKECLFKQRRYVHLPRFRPSEYKPNSCNTYVGNQESHLEKVDKYVQRNPAAKGKPGVIKIENKCVTAQNVLKHADYQARARQSGLHLLNRVLDDVFAILHDVSVRIMNDHRIKSGHVLNTDIQHSLLLFYF